MRTVAFVLACLMVGVPATLAEDAPTATEAAKPINIDQALEIAFRENPDVRAALSQLRKARAVQAEASANYNPKFSADVVHQRQGPPVEFTLPDTTTTINIVPPQDTTGKGNVFLPLDINKKLSTVSDLAYLQFQLDYLSLTRTAENLIFNVKKSYFDLLRAAGLEEVAQAAVDAAAARLKDANSKFKAGAAPKFDVTRAEVDVANYNQRLIAAKSRVAVARAVLNKAMGIDVNIPTLIVKSEVPVQPEMKLDIRAKVDEAYAKRPEVKQAETGIALNKRNVRLQRSDLLPSMDIAGTYNYNLKPTGFSTANESWIALLTLRIPIWNGGVTSAKVHQAEADVDKAQDGLDQTKLGVALEVRTAALNVQEALERISTTAEGMDLAEEALRLAMVRYNAGLATLVEVSDAESARTEAQFNYVQAKYDYAISLADLERATATQPEMAKVQLLGPAGGGRTNAAGG